MIAPITPEQRQKLIDYGFNIEKFESARNNYKQGDQMPDMNQFKLTPEEINQQKEIQKNQTYSDPNNSTIAMNDSGILGNIAKGGAAGFMEAQMLPAYNFTAKASNALEPLINKSKYGSKIAKAMAGAMWNNPSNIASPFLAGNPFENEGDKYPTLPNVDINTDKIGNLGKGAEIVGSLLGFKGAGGSGKGITEKIASKITKSPLGKNIVGGAMTGATLAPLYQEVNRPNYQNDSSIVNRLPEEILKGGAFGGAIGGLGGLVPSFLEKRLSNGEISRKESIEAMQKYGNKLKLPITDYTGKPEISNKYWNNSSNFASFGGIKKDAKIANEFTNKEAKTLLNSITGDGGIKDIRDIPKKISDDVMANFGIHETKKNELYGAFNDYVAKNKDLKVNLNPIKEDIDNTLNRLSKYGKRSSEYENASKPLLDWKDAIEQNKGKMTLDDFYTLTKSLGSRIGDLTDDVSKATEKAAGGELKNFRKTIYNKIEGKSTEENEEFIRDEINNTPKIVNKEMMSDISEKDAKKLQDGFSLLDQAKQHYKENIVPYISKKGAGEIINIDKNQGGYSKNIENLLLDPSKNTKVFDELSQNTKNLMIFKKMMPALNINANNGEIESINPEKMKTVYENIIKDRLFHKILSPELLKKFKDFGNLAQLTSSARRYANKGKTNIDIGGTYKDFAHSTGIIGAVLNPSFISKALLAFGGITGIKGLSNKFSSSKMLRNLYMKGNKVKNTRYARNLGSKLTQSYAALQEDR